MKKLRTDAAWAKLTKKQSNQLKNWLFDDKLGYAQAHERAKQEFGYGGSVSSVRRFYYRACEEQMEEDLLEANETAEHFAETPVKDEVLRKSAVRMLVAVLQRQLVLEPEKAREWAWLARLAVMGESQEIQREANRIEEERNRLREESLRLQTERWQYNQALEIRKRLPELNEVVREEKRANMTEFDHGKEINAIQRILFGAGQESHAECQEEKDAMEQAAEEYADAPYPVKMRKIEEAMWETRAALKAGAEQAELENDEEFEEGDQTEPEEGFEKGT